MTDPAPCPHVYQAINRISAAFANEGIAKTHINVIEQYQYRSIDDVLNRLSPLLAKHRLCVLPRVIAREEHAIPTDFDSQLASVRLDVEFDLVSARDGSCHTARAWGEALDASDKGTAKAMSAAFKAAMFQIFCIPVGGDDTDRATRRRRLNRTSAPSEGWDRWCTTLEQQIDPCSTPLALALLRTGNEAILCAMQRERPDLYFKVGERFRARQADLFNSGIAEPAEETSEA